MSKYPTYQQARWRLNDLYAGFEDPKIEETYQNVDELTSTFEGCREKLSAEMPEETFMLVVKNLETLSKLSINPAAYAQLSFAGETQNQTAQAMIARSETFAAEISNRVLFFSLWWKELDEANAMRLMQNSGDYRYWLEQIRNFKPYTLTEAEEKIINIKDLTGGSALRTLYQTITNRYVYKLEVDGEMQELTRGQLSVLVRSTDADTRQRAYQELYRVYGEDAPVLGQIYQTLVRDWRNENIALRKFSKPIAVRNLINDIPDDVVDTLMAVTRKNAAIFHRFFKLKAKILGVEKLRRYDVYAPVAGESDKEFGFAEGAQMVLESFEQFDPQFAKFAQQVLDENHVDSEVRKGKMDGAFCATINPELTPWVLVNYQKKADDVATLAHELGHAIHSLMAQDHSLFTQSSCLPLAETASTFGEIMLVERLLEQEPDANLRKDLLFRQMDDAFATILRQIYFAIFEKEAHDLIDKDASVDDLCAAYLNNLKEEFGDSVDVSDEFKYEWVSIPHIFDVPFYVYAYAFGQLLVFCLYKQYQEEGEAFKPRYKKILAAGGSVAPAKLLAEAGIDIHQAAFWQGGYDVIESMVAKLEKLEE